VIIDTSALIAIPRDEPEAAAIARGIEAASDLRISAVNFLEAAAEVLGARHPPPGRGYPRGVLLEAAPVFALTRPEDVAGMLAYQGPPKTIEEMDAAIAAAVARRRARGRY
jgi:uncharacterized protein with PIN domain